MPWRRPSSYQRRLRRTPSQRPGTAEYERRKRKTTCARPRPVGRSPRRRQLPAVLAQDPRWNEYQPVQQRPAGDDLTMAYQEDVDNSTTCRATEPAPRSSRRGPWLPAPYQTDPYDAEPVQQPPAADREHESFRDGPTRGCRTGRSIPTIPHQPAPTSTRSTTWCSSTPCSIRSAPVATDLRPERSHRPAPSAFNDPNYFEPEACQAREAALHRTSDWSTRANIDSSRVAASVGGYEIPEGPDGPFRRPPRGRENYVDDYLASATCSRCRSATRSTN